MNTADATTDTGSPPYPEVLPDQALQQRLATAQTPRQLIGQAVPDLLALPARLHALGFDAVATSRRFTALVDQLTRCLLALHAAALGGAPGAYAWMAAGSQGRGEQTPHTDQDTALIHEDGLGPDAREWFRQLAIRVRDDLAACGIPACAGGVSADTDDWRGDVSTWTGRVLTSLTLTDPVSVRRTAHYFDLRTIAGAEELFQPIRDQAIHLAGTQQRYCQLNAEKILRDTPAPLRWPRRFPLDRDGRIDLKAVILLPLTLMAQRISVLAGGRQRHTLDRLHEAVDCGALSRNRANDLALVYEIACRFRLRHVLACPEDQRNNRLDPTALAPYERRLLKSLLLELRLLRRILTLEARAGVETG